MTKHYFLKVNRETKEITHRDTTTAYGEYVGALWYYLIEMFDTGEYKTHNLVHLHPKPEFCKTYREDDIANFIFNIVRS